MRTSEFSSSASALSVSVETSPALSRIESVWRDLEARAEAPPFFLSWHWIGAWLLSVEERPSLLLACEGDRILGAALLLVARQWRLRMFVVPTAFLNQTGDPDRDVITIEFNDVLAEAGRETAVRRAVLAFLAESSALDGDRYDAFIWRGALPAVEADLAALRLPWRTISVVRSAQVDLDFIRRSGLSYLSHLSRNTRHQIRRSCELYRARGGLSLDIASSINEALGFFHAAGVLHQDRWQRRGEFGAFAFPFYVRFHELLIRTGIPVGAVELIRVRAGDRPIGYLYNFIYRGRVSYYFSGFAYEDDNRLKPGLVTHSLCIAHHLAAGRNIYDFMGGSERYKTNLGQPGPSLVGVIMERRSAIIRLETMLRSVKRRLENYSTQCNLTR